MLQEKFTDIYKNNSWLSKESVSGPGSSLRQTEAIRKALPSLIEAYEINSVLDIPCGDYGWWAIMVEEYANEDRGAFWNSEMNYIGADIVPEIIEFNKVKYPNVDFRVLDLVNDELPKADLIFCRDCLGHLSNANVRLALKNIKASGSEYFMATTFYDPKWQLDTDIEDGTWRPINLIKQFHLGHPLMLLSEELEAGDRQFTDKSLGLWKVSRIPW